MPAMRRALFLGVLLTFAPTAALAEDARILMLGNSYTQQGDMQVHVAAALEGAVPSWTDVYTERLTAGGLTLADHAARADGSEGETAWSEALVTGPDAGSWDIVVLQDQSQVPGFPQTEPMWQDSRDGAVILDGLIADGGGETLFLMTWGRRDGDASNPTLYPDFSTMQERLMDGYLAYADACSSGERQAWIAPAGLAFQQVHDGIVAAGEDPTADGSLFHKLYSGDGSHPDVAGSYLAGLAVAVGITGRSVVGIDHPPEIDGETAAALQQAAVDAAQPFGDVPYRWAFEWADYESPEDVYTGGVVISSLVTRPVVRLTEAGEAPDGLTVGATHDGGLVGAGELRVAGGSLAVGGLLAVADSGELAFRLDDLGRSSITVDGEAVIAGVVSVQVDEDADPGEWGQRVLLTATSFYVDEIRSELPEGFELEIEPGDGVEQLVLTWGEQVTDDDDSAGDDDDDAADDDATVDEPGGDCSCSCGSRHSAKGAVALVLVVAAGSRLRRGRRLASFAP
jgi:hypothetical protein